MATLHRLPRPSPAETTARRPGLLVDVAVLTTDATLFETVRSAVGEQNPVWRAGTAEETVDLLLSGRCGVLLVDMATNATPAATLIEQIREQFPDVVVVVAGRRDDETPLGKLVSEGLVYRFMHKPLTPKRAGMFLQAAIRRHVEIRDPERRRRQATAEPASARQHEVAKWIFVAGGVLAFVALLWLASGVRRGRPDPQPTTPPAVAVPAVTPEAPAVRADPVLSSARAAFAAGRFEAPPGRNALDLYQAVLLARPDSAEARAGLERTVARLVEQARIAHARGDRDEARRLLTRLQGVAAVDPNVEQLRLALEPEAATAERRPPAAERKAATPEPVPVAARPQPVARTPKVARVEPPPPLPSASPAPRPARVVRDPLLPVVAATPSRPTSSGGSARARAYGAPITTGLPIAGYAGEAPASAAGRSSPGTAPPLHSVALEQLEPLEAADPVYPPDALRAGVEGRVEIAFTVTETGAVRDVGVVASTPPGVFDEAALAAIERWRFRPRAVNGQPVALRSTATLRFEVRR